MTARHSFGSKIAPWFAAVSGLNATIALILSWSAATDGYAWTDIPFCGGLIVFAVLIPGWMSAATRYTFEGETLVIRSGPLLTRLPLAEITGAAPQRSFAPAPALSNDRVRLDRRTGKSLFISPRDREGFLARLAEQIGRPQNPK